MNKDLKHKYKYLNHIKNGNLFFFVELDLNEYMSQETYEKFSLQIKERSKIRNQITKQEDNYDLYIKNL